MFVDVCWRVLCVLFVCVFWFVRGCVVGVLCLFVLTRRVVVVCCCCLFRFICLFVCLLCVLVFCCARLISCCFCVWVCW